MFTMKVDSIVSKDHIGSNANNRDCFDNWSCAQNLAVRIYNVVKNTFLLLASIVLSIVSIRAITSSKLNLVMGGGVLLVLNAPLMSQSISLIYEIFCDLFFLN